MDLFKALPTADSVLQLEPEELAPYLLEYLTANKQRLNLNNMFGSGLGDGVTFHYKNDPRVEQAFREAWSWLAREGLLIEKEHGWFFISRRGERLKGRQDFAAFHRANVLPKGSLHPVIAERVCQERLHFAGVTPFFDDSDQIKPALLYRLRSALSSLFGFALLGASSARRRLSISRPSSTRPGPLSFQPRHAVRTIAHVVPFSGLRV